MNEIAEIVCPSCMYGCDCLIRGKADITKCPTIKAILALIERREKPMREVLKEAREFISHHQECRLYERKIEDKGATKVLAKIDSILKEQ